MEYKRADRVSNQLLKEAAEVLEFEIRDPRLKEVTITGVKISDDLRHAKLYYSTPSDDGDVRENIAKSFKKALGFIKKSIARRMVLKYMPEISFHFDEALEHSRHIDELLRKASEDLPRLVETEDMD